jgi:tRNA(Arg) A34 adenosine deaminase TadA
MSGHEQTAIEDRRGWWHVECDCGAVGVSRPTNYDAWRVPLEHSGLSAGTRPTAHAETAAYREAMAAVRHHPEASR